MNIKELNDCSLSKIIFKKDINGREIKAYTFKDCSFVGSTLYYPNILIKTSEGTFKPLKEKIMSLKNIDMYVENDTSTTDKKVLDKDFNFFFVYNTDNYYHFIYDTLPYLITFNKLKKKLPKLKLLMSYPNPAKTEFYKFVTEYLALCNIKKRDIKIVNKNTIYKNIIVSTSYTHDIDSNLPPRKEIYTFYKQLSSKVKCKSKTPKKIYISRRSYLHGDTSNIGTNYTSRRKMVNENELVSMLVKQGFTEVFTELMTTSEKISMFANAEHVVGAIGGGLCNVLFSNKKCKLTAIVSPHFLKVNKRFKYSFSKVNLQLFSNTKNIESSKFKTYMRVKVNNIIGEITHINNNDITISYSDTPIAGWNSNVVYNTKVVKEKECVKLDNGINSPWSVNLNKLLPLISIK